MANLTVDSTKAFMVETIERATHPANIAVTAGQWVTLDATTGKWILANATTATAAGVRRACAVRSCTAGEALTAIYRGIMNMGEAFVAMPFGARVYLSDTAGTSSDTVGTTTVTVGTITVGWASGPNADRLLRVDN